jgi:hypothetical protein
MVAPLRNVFVNDFSRHGQAGSVNTCCATDRPDDFVNWALILVCAPGLLKRTPAYALGCYRLTRSILFAVANCQSIFAFLANTHAVLVVGQIGLF